MKSLQTVRYLDIVLSGTSSSVSPIFYPPPVNFQEIRKDMLSGRQRAASDVTCQPRSLSTSRSLSSMTHVQCASRRFISAAIPGTPYTLGFAIVGDSLKRDRIVAPSNIKKLHDEASASVEIPTDEFPIKFLQTADDGSKTSVVKILPKGPFLFLFQCP